MQETKEGILEESIIENSKEEQEPWYKGPIRIILTIFLLLIITLWTYAYYGIKLDPNPTRIPSINDVVPYYELNTTQSKLNREDYTQLVNPSDPIIKQTADKIASISCDGNRICQAKAIYYFIRDNYEYIADPVGQEYIEDPKEFIKIGGGDCESGSISLSALLESIGIVTEFVFIPGHAFLKIKLPEASKRYKINDWIYLDWTCKNCGFGEVPLKNRKDIVQ